ncbi:hypothetical protein ACW9I6_00465 [Pseudomonas sp. SDO5522_S412]
MTASTPELQRCLDAYHKYRLQAVALSVAALLMMVAMQQLPAESVLLVGRKVGYHDLFTVLLATLFLAGALAWAGYTFHRLRQRSYANTLDKLNNTLQNQQLSAVQNTIATVREQAKRQPLIAEALQSLQLPLNQHLDNLTRRQLHSELAAECAKATRQCDQRLKNIKNRIPLVMAENSVRNTLSGLQQRREQLHRQWQQAYPTLSWWNKLKYGGELDFSEMDKTIHELEKMQKKMLCKHAEDFALLDTHFAELSNRAKNRIISSQQQIQHFIATEVTREQVENLPLTAALWFSALSVPISAWADMATAGDIYDALREVNGNYAGMSDAEVWWQTLFMPSEQLAGLASLTKGAYFEQLVAADTSGTLFEHFNNPGTDIIIDGQAYQLKATASAVYVNSVEEDIPVIATSEVAEQTRAINSGYSNEELERSVELALGDSVIDVKDTAADALLSGIGGLGLFATIQGINHAAERHKNGGDGVESIFEGVGVAIEGTARALVGTAELGYKVLASRPSRFVGRVLLTGLKKLDKKMMGQ